MGVRIYNIMYGCIAAEFDRVFFSIAAAPIQYIIYIHPYLYYTTLLESRTDCFTKDFYSGVGSLFVAMLIIGIIHK